MMGPLTSFPPDMTFLDFFGDDQLARDLLGINYLLGIVDLVDLLFRLLELLLLLLDLLEKLRVSGKRRRKRSLAEDAPVGAHVHDEVCDGADHSDVVRLAMGEWRQQTSV